MRRTAARPSGRSAGDGHRPSGRARARRPWLILFACGAVGWPLPSARLAAQGPAPAGGPLPAEPDPTSRFPYAPRGERCEGFYSRLLSVPLLRLVSFTTAREDFEPRAAESVLISWGEGSGAADTIQAESMVRRQRYLMSVVVPARTGRFLWPQDVLARAAELRGNDLALLAWTGQRIAGVQERVYLPVTLTRTGGASAGPDPAVEVISDQQLIRVSTTLSRVDPETGSETSVYTEKDAGGAPYIPLTRVRIPIEPDLVPGLYYIRVIAVYPDADAPEGTSRTATDVWFLSPGGRE